MNSKLETEYEKISEQELSFVDSDALWNRIEAALPEREKEAVNQEENTVIDIKTGKKWYKKTGFVSLAGTCAAACVLVIVFKTFGLGRGYPAYEATAPSDNSYCNEATTTDEYVDEIASSENVTQESEMAEACVVLNVSVETVEESDGYMECKVIEGYDVLDNDSIIYVEKDDAIEVGKNYNLQLVFVSERDGKNIYRNIQ